MSDRSKAEITGGGAVPPPDAQQETAQPLQRSTIAVQLERAAQNERPLPPFNPKPLKGVRPQPVAAAVTSPKPTSTEDLIGEFFGSDVPTQPPVVARGPDRPTLVVPGQGEPVPSLDPAQGEIDQLEDILPELTAEDRLRMPAASDTDTPAKGLLPHLTPPSGDKFDGISRGGFGDIGEAQYFPLSGDEALELACALADDLVARCRNDLRFSMALTYPRIRMRLVLEVEGHAEDNNAGFEIQTVAAPKDSEKGGTPMEVARARANQVCFVLQSSRQEFTPDGESDRPPDAIRSELGLSIPRKQIVDAGGHQSFVDVIPALTQ